VNEANPRGNDKPNASTHGSGQNAWTPPPLGFVKIKVVEVYK
jgi:hypothetical protein